MNRIETMNDYTMWLVGDDGLATITSKSQGRIPVPCLRTVLIRTNLVVENLYNPNTVSPDKMALLHESVMANGFTFPIAVVHDPDQGCFVVVDGAHRRLILGPEWLDCDYLPCVVLPHGMARRLAATWQFNKARGTHEVDKDADLIRALVEQGLDDGEVAGQLGISVDDVYRYKQVAGVAELFRDAAWSGAWEMREDGSPA